METAYDVIASSRPDGPSSGSNVSGETRKNEYVSDQTLRDAEQKGTVRRLVDESLELLGNSASSLINDWWDAKKYSRVFVPISSLTREFLRREMAFVLERVVGSDQTFAQNVVSDYDLNNDAELTLAYTVLLVNKPLNGAMASRLEAYWSRNNEDSPFLATNILRAIDITQERSGSGAFSEIEDVIEGMIDEALDMNRYRGVYNQREEEISREEMIAVLASFFASDRSSQAFIEGIASVAKGDITPEDIEEWRQPVGPMPPIRYF